MKVCPPFAKDLGSVCCCLIMRHMLTYYFYTTACNYYSQFIYKAFIKFCGYNPMVT